MICANACIQQIRFNRLSDTIVGRIDDMGAKIDELEKSLNELMDQAGVESTPSESVTKSDGNETATVKR
jgi:heat shock factor-binding protein 1